MAHMIKGAAQLLGARGLAYHSLALEDAIHGADNTPVPALAADFIAELERVLDALRELAPAAPVVPRGALNVGEREQARALLLAVAPLLEAADYEARQLLNQLGLLLAGSTYASRYAALCDAFDELDTDAAAALAVHLAAELGA
jgi:chemotaxis protein histidine kinase CheA